MFQNGSVEEFCKIYKKIPAVKSFRVYNIWVIIRSLIINGFLRFALSPLWELAQGCVKSMTLFCCYENMLSAVFLCYAHLEKDFSYIVSADFITFLFGIVLLLFWSASFEKVFISEYCLIRMCSLSDINCSLRSLFLETCSEWATKTLKQFSRYCLCIFLRRLLSFYLSVIFTEVAFESTRRGVAF